MRAHCACAGAALAAGKGKLAVEGAAQAGKAVQDAVPEGAANPATREQRNSSCAAAPRPAPMLAPAKPVRGQPSSAVPSAPMTL